AHRSLRRAAALQGAAPSRHVARGPRCGHVARVAASGVRRMSDEAQAALDRLDEAEASLARPERLTLDPARPHARSLAQIGERLLSQPLPVGLAGALADGLAATAAA